MRRERLREKRERKGVFKVDIIQQEQVKASYGSDSWSQDKNRVEFQYGLVK